MHDDPRIFFTADPHFGHANIIASCARPFADVEDMNETLVAHWNGVVRACDEVYVLGDAFYRGDPRLAQALLDRLAGRKHLVLGNHDKTSRSLKGWASIEHYHETTVGGVQLVLSHYPFKSWSAAHWGSIQLYGHVHARLPSYCNQIDVGVDRWSFTPMTLPDLMRASRFDPVYVPEDYPPQMKASFVSRLDALYRRVIGEGIVEATQEALSASSP